MAGILDIFRKRTVEAAPEPDPFTILGVDPVAAAPVVLTVILIGLLIYYQPRFVVEFLKSALGDMLAWVVMMGAVFATMALYLYAFTDLGAIAALIGAVLLLVVVGIIGLFGS